MHKNIFFWIAISWTGIVSFLCLVQSSDIPAVSILNLDKLVHVFFHFLITLLWFLYLKKQVKPESNYLPWKIPFFFSVFFGIGIEVCQELFTTTRKADVFDFLANLSGAILAVIVIMGYSKIKNK
ncbi:VanZ family protein [Flavobacterium sp. K5-23]|uniref:VanZ family protein n=1 Tax=Flavobacterium sp. K5-23 TaxID=2746225 RepID=UPI00200CDCC7|nr:VanZ family protein [Flavobacterium sp. K5-23]UQD55195.1 VanZ family protein [Flavobacterium sp. K5-23]